MLPQQQAPLDVERARVRDLMRYGPVSAPCSVACLYYYIQKAEPPIDTSLANYRYYKPKVKSQKPSISSNCAPDVVPEDCTDGDPVSMPALEEPETPDSAQLFQYILAKATRSVSLLSQEECNPGDEVYLGPRIMDLTWGVCPNTIQVFIVKDESLNISTAHVMATPNFYVMNDLSAIDSFKDRPYV
ncbi:hypothetical protein DL95DRAFT_470080 [Leptodontidium sp. 2 PMI_412]|nr:hypothetical protein DL95DRAFT_470080 [Leptodontidium sp. 2 PMI_412]